MPSVPFVFVGAAHLKMADGLCTGEQRATNLIEQISQLPHHQLPNDVVDRHQLLLPPVTVTATAGDVRRVVAPFYDHVAGGGCAKTVLSQTDSSKTTTSSSDVDITLDLTLPASPSPPPAAAPPPSTDDDCRKKRCVDRYDSSESSDSGVAILSCTDCSGSSTASSDIVDPGSPFSTGSTHSDDSASNQHQPTKMPPTHHLHHHQPHTSWPWAKEESPKQRQAMKRKESSENTNTATTLLSTIATTTTLSTSAPTEPSPKKRPTISVKLINNTSNSATTTSSSSTQTVQKQKQNVAILSAPITAATELLDASKSFPRLQQGKITEYFKAQFKSSALLKKELSNIMVKTVNTANPNSKFGTSGGGGGQTKVEVVMTAQTATKKPIPRWRRPQPKVEKPRVRARVVPRKILPAPSKPTTENSSGTSSNSSNSSSMISMGPITTSAFPSIITTLIPNVYTIQSKGTVKPSESSHATTTNNTHAQGQSQGGGVPPPPRTSSIFMPIVTRGTQPLSIIQPLQKVTTINNFVKLPAILKFHPATAATATPGVITTTMPTVTTAMMPAIRGLPSPIPPPTITQQQPLVCPHPETPIESLVINEDAKGDEEEDEDDEEEDDEGVVQTSQLPEELSPADSGVSSNLELQIIDDDLPKVAADKSQKSPILSQPKTIRFPAKERSALPAKEKLPARADQAACQWDQCAAYFDTNGALLEHLQVKHVISQAAQEQYVCLWHGCKVHGRKSCSRTWLERHVLAHAGSKPFRCIVDGCGQRFNSQLALERHVNGHFSSDSTPHTNAKKSVENASTKLFKRNGKKIRFRRQPWSARMFDFIDAGMMEGLQYRLLTMTETRTNGKFDSTDDGHTVTLSSQILAKRVEMDGTRKLLLRWHPNDIVDDEWILENDYRQTQTVHIPRLQPTAKDNLRPILFPPSFNYRHSSSSSGRQKHRRKLSKVNT